MSASNAKPTVVVVHGAWADGSSWSKVIQRLQAEDVAVVAAPIPLTSLSEDVKALDRMLERVAGPALLAAHAYAGAVIGSTRNERVRGLVFVAALAPDEGETVADVFYREPPHPMAPHLAPDSDGLIWMPEAGFASAFAQHASKQDNALFAAVQRPISVACIQEKVPAPLWKRLPSWYCLAGQDRMINPHTQEFMASRMKATLHRTDADHIPMATAPDDVVSFIREALRDVSS